MTFRRERLTGAEPAVQFLTSNDVKADAANWVVSSHADFTAPALGVRMHWDGVAWRGEQASYVIKRVYQGSGRRRTMKTGQSRAMAQAHCEDPHTATGISMDVRYAEDDWCNEAASDALKEAAHRAGIRWPRYWVNGKPARTIDLNGPRNDTDGGEGTPDTEDEER